MSCLVLNSFHSQLHVEEEELEEEVQEAGHLEVVELRHLEEEGVHLNNLLKFSSSVEIENSIQLFLYMYACSTLC